MPLRCRSIPTPARWARCYVNSMTGSESKHPDWLGQGAIRRETVTPRLIEHFRATLDGYLTESEVPLGLFWAICPDALGAGQLGRDGHPRTGTYLPERNLPRRMWAGGELRFHREFRLGETVTRISRIERIFSRTGSTGPLDFTIVRHRYLVEDTLVLDERQDLVYREDPKPAATEAVTAVPPTSDFGEPSDRMEIKPNPVLLFRFSALTFNGHRIHYDYPYATGVEGYDGLVVHGPLQAVLMLNLAARVYGRSPKGFTYRGVSPLTAGKPVEIEAYPGDNKEDLVLRVRIRGGAMTMTGKSFL